MADQARYTAYCGLYCQDCIPSDRRLFDLLDELDGRIEELQLEKYAALKAEKEEAFRDYPAFVAVLQALRRLRCESPCAEGGCKPGCAIRACVREKGYDGCRGCGDFESCRLLAPLTAHHPGLLHNLRMIKAYGPWGWSGRSGKHYRWQ
jgi:hypothetical protein